MAFWCRIKQSQLKIFKRCYSQILGLYSANEITSVTRICKENLVFHKSQFEYCNNVRFFAAPVQAKPKQEEKDTNGPRLNEQITSPYVRLVTDEGHGVVSRHEALERAKRLDLDLVEVQRTAKPPVCKLMDYHREKYKQQIKEKDRSKSKSEMTLRKGDCKEVRFAAKIEQKDLQMKADTVKRLIDRGYRVKCMAVGNEDQDLGGLLARLSALIEDVSIVESGPRVEKKQAYVIVRHVKFGPSKKGSKKASKIEATSSNIQKVASSATATNPMSQSSFQFEGNDDSESEYETNEDILSEEPTASPSVRIPGEALSNNKSSWLVCDTSDNFNNVFDVSGIVRSSPHKQMETSPDAFPKFDSTAPVLATTRGVENRYKKESRNSYPPSREIGFEGPEPRGSTRVQPHFDFRSSTPSRETRNVQADGNLPRPTDGVSLRERSHPGAPSAPNSPGQRNEMLNAPRASYSAEKQSSPAEVNRYKKGVNPNSSASNSSGSRRGDVGGQRSWGAFGTDKSDTIPGRNTENQRNVQR